MRCKKFRIDGVGPIPACSKWSRQYDVLAVLAVLTLRGGEGCEISGKHLRCGNELLVHGRHGANSCRLFATKEKQFVLYDRSANHASKLIPFQTVVGKRVGVSGIHRTVAEELKRISVNGIRSRFGDAIYSAGCVMSVLSGYSAGFYFEFLQRIREGERQIQIVFRIVMRSPVQKIIETAVSATRD